MAIAAWDILTYNGSDWINQKWTQGPLGIGTNGAPAGQLEVVGTSDEIQLLVIGNNPQVAAGIVAIKQYDGTPVSAVLGNGQTSLTINDGVQFSFPLRLNHTTSLTPAAGFGLGIQFFGFPALVHAIANITVIMTDVSSGLNSTPAAYLTLGTMQGSDSAPLEVLRCTEHGSVSIGFPTALSVSAADGFLYIPTMAGSPSPPPTPRAVAGKVPMVYDTSNNKLWVYNTAWKSVTLT